MYCSIEEAWNNQQVPQFQTYFARDSNDITNVQQSPTTYSVPPKLYIDKETVKESNNLMSLDEILNNSHEHFNNNNNNIDCQTFLKHLSKCMTCKNKLNSYNRMPNYFSNDVREIIIILMIGIFVILILDLFLKILIKLKKT